LETFLDLLAKAAFGMGGWLSVFTVYVMCRRFADTLTNNRFTAFIASSKNLHRAAEDDSVGRVRELLDAGADPNLKDKKGRTPLLCAVSGESYVNTWLLLSRGADPNIPDKGGNTPLHAACELADMTAVHLLVEYGANPETKNQDGETPEAMLHTTEAWIVDRTKISIISECCLGRLSD
jgi:hypothetical protein